MIYYRHSKGTDTYCKIKKVRYKKMKDLRAMTNKELEAAINASAEWDKDMLEELCDRAEMSDEWEAADGESFEDVAYEAAKKLGLDI